MLSSSSSPLRASVHGGTQFLIVAPSGQTMANCWTWWELLAPELPEGAAAAWQSSSAPCRTTAAGPSFFLHDAHSGKSRAAQPSLQVLILPPEQSSAGSSQPAFPEPL
jgi:hypothetical protein